MGARPMWEHFVVVGLAFGKPLQTIQGDSGFLGTDQKYKPDFVDCLAQTHDSSQRAVPPPQLPTCCLPAGVDIVLHQDVATASLVPHTYAVVLTEGDGKKVYASCLSFYDKVPHALCTKHEDLLGAVALKAICLLSHQPYLASTDKVLRELYHIAFVGGSTVPLPDIISGLLSVPCPHIGGPQVCLNLGRCQCVLSPPLAVGPPPGELSLRPLLEVLQPDNLAGLFAAVLLEQRVLLRSCHHWLLTAVAEGIIRLLHPLKYQHVYIPVMPISLTDYLDAPTPFLMGLHSSEYVEPHIQQQLVVLDLDADTLSPGKSNTLLQLCLSHPYMLQLRSRVRMLMRPSVTDVDTVGQQRDPWVLAAQQLRSQPWGPCKQALLIRIFLEFFRSLLDSYQTFLVAGHTDGSRSITNRALSGVQGLLSMQMRVPGAGPSSSSGLPAGIRNGALSSMMGVLQPQSKVDMTAVQNHHLAICGPSDPSLLQQVMQGLPFLSFLEDCNSTYQSQDWFGVSEKALHDWRTAEQQLQGTAEPGPQHAATASGTEFINITNQNVSPLMPPCGLKYLSFPALLLAGAGHGPGLKLHRNNNNSRKRQSMGRRRAISELMGSQVDLRRNSSAQAALKTEAAPERQLRANGDDALLSPTSSGVLRSAALPSGGGAHYGHPATGSVAGASGQGVELGEYSIEADVVRRQTSLLVQLMHLPCGGGTATGDAMTTEELDASRLLLCMQTGGNGWFLVSRLKEIVTAGATTTEVNNSSSSSSPSVSSNNGANLFSSGMAASKCTATAKRRVSAMFPGASETPLQLQGGPSSSVHIPSSPADMVHLNNTNGGVSDNPADTSTSTRTAAHKPPRPSRSTKLLGVSKGSCGSQSASPPGLKVSHSMDSFANAAQAVASAFTVSVLNRSISSKDKNSKPSSPELRVPQMLDSTSHPGIRDDDSVRSAVCTSSQRPPVIGGHASKAVAGALEQAIESHSTAAAKAASNTRASMDDSLQAHHSTTDASSSSASSSCKLSCTCLRLVSSAAYEVLAEMMNSIIEVAAVQDDFRVVLAALQLSFVIARQPAAGARQYLLSSFVSNPILYTEWFWAGAFNFAVSSSYLQAQELVSIRDVVLLSLAEFACYVTRLGISGVNAWLLLAQLAADHCGAASASPVQPTDMLSLRAYLKHFENVACHERSMVLGSASMPLANRKASCTVAASPVAGSALAVASQLPDHVKAALRVCGLSIAPYHTDASNMACSIAPHATVPALEASSGWRVGRATEHNKPAAMGGDEQCMFSREVATERISVSNTQIASVTAVKQARFSVPGCTCALDAPEPWHAVHSALTASCSTASVLPAPEGQQQQLQQATAANLAVSSRAARPAAVQMCMHSRSPSQSRAAITATVAPKLACSFPSAATVAAEISCTETDISCSTPCSGQSSKSPSSPRSPRETAGYKALSPRGLSRLSARDARQQYNIKGISSSIGSRRNSYASSLKAATATVVNAAEPSGEAAAGANDLQTGWSCKSLLEPGALHCAALHSKPVVAVDASSHVLVSIGLDASLKVINMSGGSMRMAATLSLPSLDCSTTSSSSSSWPPACAAMPLVKLWRDGHRVAVGNAERQSLWVMDLQRSTGSVELPGLDSPISAIHMLQRNQNALLTALSRPGSICYSRDSVSVVYLWDLRQPKKPAASLGTGTTPGAAAGQGVVFQNAQGATVTGTGHASKMTDRINHSATATGVLSLTVHDDGVLAAAGCRDGSARVWDMRHPSKPLSTCSGHLGPVTQTQFLPANTAAAESFSDQGCFTSSRPEPVLQASNAVPLLLTGSEDWTARLWHATTGDCRATCVGHGGPVTAIQVAACCTGSCSNGSSTRLVTGAADGSVAVWDVKGEMQALVQQHCAPVQLLGQGGCTFISGAADRTCHVWSLPHVFSCSVRQPPGALSSLQQHAALCSMAYDPVAEMFIAGHRDGIVSVWNCSSGHGIGEQGSCC